MSLVSLALIALALGQTPREAALAQCADCHPSESATYGRTGMARALEPLREGELAGLSPVADGSGFVYAFEGNASKARLVERFEAPEGQARGGPPWRDSAPIAFAIGAGELDRSFAVKRGQRLWLAPLEVAGHGGERHAALAPSHGINPGLRFTQPLTPECMGCHTDSPPPQTWPLNQAPAEWQPRGISCAACHGEVEAHVRIQSAELSGEGDAGPDPLRAEGSWSRVQRMERCAACHLQGDARVELDPRRLGPPPPGTPLLDTRAVFVAREPSDEIGFVSHVQRLVLSLCYLESADFPSGGLSCETCHDPHRSVFEPGERALVREACLRCHESPDRDEGGERRAADCALPPAERPADRDCAACHMRPTGVFDVAEVRIHDHWIRRIPPPASPASPLRFPESPRGDWKLFTWPDQPARADASDPGPWTMALAHGGHLERAREYLSKGIGERARELPMLHHVRGSLQERGGEFEAARRSYEMALLFDPGLAEAQTNLAPLLARLGDAAAGKELLDRLLQRYPLADTAYRNRAIARLALDDEPGARADLQAVMKLLPDTNLAMALARLAEQRGDAAAVERWTREAERLDPRTTPSSQR